MPFRPKSWKLDVSTDRLKAVMDLPLYLSPPGASRPFSSQTPALYSFQSFSVNLYISLFNFHMGNHLRMRSLNSGVHDSSDGTGYQPLSGTILEYLPCDDDPLDLWVVLLNRLQNTNSTVDCRVEKLLGIIGLHMERRGGMGNSIDSLDCFIECSVLTSAFTLSEQPRLTCPISSTMTNSKFALDPLNRSARYSPLSFDRTVPTTLIPSSRNA